MGRWNYNWPPPHTDQFYRWPANPVFLEFVVEHGPSFGSNVGYLDGSTRGRKETELKKAWHHGNANGHVWDYWF